MLPIANSFGKIHLIYWMTLIYIYIYIYIYVCVCVCDFIQWHIWRIFFAYVSIRIYPLNKVDYICVSEVYGYSNHWAQKASISCKRPLFNIYYTYQESIVFHEPFHKNLQQRILYHIYSSNLKTWIFDKTFLNETYMILRILYNIS